MNDVPPNPGQPDDLDDRYRRESELDSSRPSERVRRAVFAHAARLAAERSAQSGPAPSDSGRAGANHAWRRRRPAVFGTLAAAALAGLLMTPHFLTSPAPPRLAAGAPAPAPPTGAPAPAPPTGAIEAPQEPDVSEERSSAGMKAPVPPPSRATAEGMAKRSSHSEGFSRTDAADNAAPAPMMAAQNARAKTQTMAAAREEAAAQAPDRAAALRGAAEAGDTPRLQRLLDEPVDIDGRDAMGRTALLLATLHGRAEVVDALLAHGADPNAADAEGLTPLKAAVAAHQPAIVAALRRAAAR